jgi:4-amino-4-deoxychorismate lyase
MDDDLEFLSTVATLTLLAHNCHIFRSPFQDCILIHASLTHRAIFSYQIWTAMSTRDISTMSSHVLQCVPADKYFHVFTTFRLDTNLAADTAHIQVCGGKASDIYLLPYHYRRLNEAIAKMSGFETCEALTSLESFERHIRIAAKKLDMESPGDGYPADGEPHLGIVRRGKISVWPSGHFEVSLVPVPSTFPILLPKPETFTNPPTPTWTVVLDVQATKTDLYTEIKTSYREAYDRARQSAELSPTSTMEVLLYNELNQVMDGSITNVHLFRNNRWVTPDAGGLQGAARQFALDRGFCSIASPAVSKDSLRPGEIVWLSNAFRGFFPATFSIR